ncbi:MAG: radical SAM protein [Candidatus Brocadiales bacterium]|nr:radical SAM protein [Candidatus Brocadiales bacterium]
MKDILFINMPSAFTAYKGTKLNAGMQVYPLLSFTSLGAVLRGKGFNVAVLDMGIEDEPYKKLDKTLDELKPRVVGFTSTTPLYFEVKEISGIVRKKLGPNVRIVYGGPHPTALPEDSLKETDVNIIVCSEGENTLLEIMEGKPLADINGIYYKKNGNIHSTPPRSLIRDLDALPFPALNLYDIKRYKCPKFLSKGSPTVNMETSRGCPSACTFCSKNIAGRLFRKKSPDRVLDEIKYMLKMGAGEIRIIDDQFATDINRAKIICEKIIQAGLKFPWNLGNGVRVDRVDEEFLTLAKRAGCYQVGIGFESGDQASLDGINKGIKIEEGIRCMELIRKVGLESVGFFMLGLPDDTEESLKKTVDFALRLMPDYAKVTITIPFPGTAMFEDYERRGLIKSRDWTQYNLHRAGEIYRHPHLSYATMKRYYDAFYWKYYFNPRFLTRRIVKSFSAGTVMLDVYYGLQTFFPTLFPAKPL